MEAKVWFRLVGFVFLLSSVRAVDKFVAIGGELELRPPETAPTPITSALWKHNGNLVADWSSNELVYYSTFKGRTTLNVTTGWLKIQNMTKEDEGLYTVEINHQVQSGGYNVKPLAKLPTPDILLRPLRCGPGPYMSNCSLVCNGAPENAGDITYSWRKDQQEWTKKEKTLNLTIEEVRDVKTYTCKMENAVSEEESKPYNNPFYIENKEEGSSAGSVAASIIIVILILLLGTGTGIGVWKRKDIATFCNSKFRKESPDPPAVTTEYAAVSRKTEAEIEDEQS